jgi:serine/threonine protein kinase/tetratricopeptide (TPR) repeat protein
MGAQQGKAARIFDAAVELGIPAERAAYLDAACGQDHQLRADVEELLEHDDAAGSFLDRAARPVPQATADEPSADEGPGKLIGPYKLLEQIGEGGFGVVFMAEQTQPLRRRVALKVLKPGMDSRQVVARFEAERQALALMDHPNIAKVLDGGQTDLGRPYFVMELVRGAPITDYCDQNQMSVRERLQLFVDVCRAVQHAHQKGVIHRDLKPSNVLVTERDGTPVPKVIDFGIAKALLGQQLTDKTLFTNFAQMVGTPLYMSPEQAGMSELDVDTRTDIYALGVLLYELLTGTTPFDRERLRMVGYDELRRIIREEEPPKPSTRISTLGQAATTASTWRKSDPRRLSQFLRGDLDWVVLKTLAKDRNERYATAKELADDVQRYLRDEPVVACPPSAAYRLRKLVRRHKSKVAAAALMLVLLLAGTAVSTWQAVRATRAEREAGNALAQVTAAQTQTREALDVLTDDVVGTVFTRQPELGEAEKGFLRKVLGFYEAFTRQSGETAEARFLRAKGYFKVAWLRSLLGEPREAEAGFRQAGALLSHLADEFPDVAEYRHRLGRTEGDLAVELAKQGKDDEALAAFRAGIDVRTKLAEQFPGEMRYRLDLASNYGDLGNLYELQHRDAEAEVFYRQDLDLKEGVIKEAGNVPQFQLDWAFARARFGQLMRKQGKHTDSEKVYREVLKVQLEQLDKVPPTTRDREFLAGSYHGLGIALAEQKRWGEAETAFRQALDLRKDLAEEFPRVLEHRRHLASGYGDLGRLLGLQGKYAAAAEQYRQNLELRKKIVAQAGAAPRDRQELAESYHSQGYVLRVLHRPEEAEPAFRAAIDLWKKLIADFPLLPDFHGGLANTYGELAQLHNERGEFSAALAILEEARPHVQSALAARPKDLGFREIYRDHLEARAATRRGLGDHAGVATTADELAGCGYQPARDTYNAACLLSACVTLAGKDDRLDAAKRVDLAGMYADRALAMLRQTLEYGFTDAARLSNDPDLELLRTRDEFRKLAADLEAKTKK